MSGAAEAGPGRLRRRFAGVGIGSGAWLFVAVFRAADLYVRRLRSEQEPIAFVEALLPNLVRVAVWGAVLTPLTVALCRSYPLEELGKSRRVVVGQVLGLIVLPLLAGGLVTLAIRAVFVGWPVPLEAVLAGVVSRLHESVFLYAGLLAVLLGLSQLSLLERRQLQEQRLRAQLAQSRLAALRMQLHPHFLFNTLNTLLSLIYDDRAKAARTVQRLSDLLKRTLDPGAPSVVPLSDEVELVRLYLEIEEARFDDRLTSAFRIDPAATGAAVPSLILQPLVENAIKHGLSRKPGAGRVEVEARVDGGLLVLTVLDDGPGLAPGPSTRGGVGLDNTRRRLVELYGERQSLTLENRETGGARVRLALPFTRVAA